MRRITRLERVVAQLRITGLPTAVIDDTVRISVEGPALATNVRAALDTPPTAVAPEESPDVREAKRLVALAAADLTRLGAALDRLRSSSILAADPTDDPPAPWAAIVAARRAMLALRTERELALRDQLAAARRREREMRERLDAALDRDRRAGNAHAAKPHELRKQLDIELQATGEGTLTIVIEYLVAAARWAPSYVARIDGGNASLEIRAFVAQATGEDWIGAKLALSTAEPTRFAQLPELAAQRIGRRQAEPGRSGFRAPPAGADALYADFMRHLAATRPPPAVPPATVPTTVTFELDSEEPELVDALEAPYDRDEGGAVRERARSFAEQVWDEESSAAKGAFQTPPGGRPIPAPPPAPMALSPMSAPEKPKPKTAGRHSATVLGNAYGGAPPMQSAPPPAVPQPRLDYGGLVMADAESSSRGSLIAAPIDPSRAGAEAVLSGRLSQLEALRLPPGCSEAWSHAYDYSYATDGAVDVKADGAWHGIAVTSSSAAVALRHVAVPREQADVFRMATLANPFGGPLLPAPIDVYDRGRFLVTSSVDYAPPGAEIEIGLGVDAAIKVARNTEFREETSGMLRGSLKLFHTVKIDVDNVSSAPIDLEVRERIPVKREGEDDIEIEPGRIDPPWEPWHPDADGPRSERLRGGYRWRVTLAAGAKKSLRAAYEIKIPSKAELVGGNRRES